jgi:hypothetical protein
MVHIVERDAPRDTPAPPDRHEDSDGDFAECTVIQS